jgi:L-lactate dehydrogenase complex protein LldE
MRVSLFIPCLVDQFFPQVGVQMARILARLGLTLTYPAAQTCCGQPLFNSGHWREAAAFARRMIDVFSAEDADFVVGPSGSCLSMVRNHFGSLELSAPHRRRWEELAPRCKEFSEFLVDVLGVEDLGARWSARVAYHHSCHLLRDLGVEHAPRRLLGLVEGLTVVEWEADRVCCGFGGVFSVKLPEISVAMGERKLAGVARAEADWLVANDAGCLMQLGGLLRRRGSPMGVLHLVEVLARAMGISGEV